MDTATDWYKYSFADDYLRIYRHRDHSEAMQAVEALLGQIQLSREALCFDLCCGAGRHLVALRSMEYRAIGLDLSATLLREAAVQPAVEKAVVRGDMRQLPFGTRFDAAFSFFTSFGYFADAQNQQVVGELARILKPGAPFIIDFLNAAHVRRHLVPENTEEFGDFTLKQQRWIDEQAQTVNKTLTVTDEAGMRTYREEVKLYERSWFEATCQSVGLQIDRVLGDYQAAAYTADSPRMIMIGHRVPGASS